MCIYKLLCSFISNKDNCLSPSIYSFVLFLTHLESEQDKKGVIHGSLYKLHHLLLWWHSVLYRKPRRCSYLCWSPQSGRSELLLVNLPPGPFSVLTLYPHSQFRKLEDFKENTVHLPPSLILFKQGWEQQEELSPEQPDTPII